MAWLRLKKRLQAFSQSPVFEDLWRLVLYRKPTLKNELRFGHWQIGMRNKSLCPGGQFESDVVVKQLLMQMIIRVSPFDAELVLFVVESERIGNEEFDSPVIDDYVRDSRALHSFYGIKCYADLRESKSNPIDLNKPLPFMLSDEVRKNQQSILTEDSREIDVSAQPTVLFLRCGGAKFEVWVIGLEKLMAVEPTRGAADEQCLPKEVFRSFVNQG
jgi:hypothetical protein